MKQKSQNLQKHLKVLLYSIHHEEDSSDDKSQEIEPPKQNGEQEIGKQNDICSKPPSPFSNVHLRNTTKILQQKFFTLKLLFIFTLSLLNASFPQTMSLSFFIFAPSFIFMDLSIMSTSTSFTFSEFIVLFLIIFHSPNL